ncbi:MAG: dTDP-4-dehydrorhamnose reductase [Pseudomonadota bacterium]
MNRHKILLIGAQGQVGTELSRTLQPIGDVVPVDIAGTPLTIDLGDHASIGTIVRRVNPSIIVNAAAYTAVDQAEQEPGIAQTINADAPGILAEEAKTHGALMVHYSTDYVYDGTKPEPFVETDTPDPQNVYGKTKLAGDEAIAAAGCDYFIFRTSWVYGLYGRNFLLTMQKLAREQDKLQIVSDQIGGPTWSRMIAETTAQVLGQLNSPLCDRDASELSGVYHLTCGGKASWYDFAKAIVDNEENPPAVEPIATADYPVPAKRPLNSLLSNDKLAETFGLRLPDWDTALALCLSTGK